MSRWHPELYGGRGTSLMSFSMQVRPSKVSHQNRVHISVPRCMYLAWLKALVGPFAKSRA